MKKKTKIEKTDQNRFSFMFMRVFIVLSKKNVNRQNPVYVELICQQLSIVQRTIFFVNIAIIRLDFPIKLYFPFLYHIRRIKMN